MNSMRGIWVAVWVLGVWFGSVGCATVDPGADFALAEERAFRGSGVERLYDPARAEEDAALVESLLAEGLTAESAAQIALLHHPAIQSGLNGIGVSRAEVVQAGLLSNPMLGVAFRFPSGGGLTNIEFDLAQRISELWQIPARRRAAEAGLASTVLGVSRLACRTAAEARGAYYRVVGRELRLALARENLALADKALELTGYRRDAGAGSELDVNLARGSRLEAELATREARLAASSARRELAMTLGLSVDAAGIRIVGSLPGAPAHGLDDATMLALALEERLDLLAARAAVSTAEERLALERGRVFGDVSLGVALERQSRAPGRGRDVLADTARASVAAGRLTAPSIEPRSSGDAGSGVMVGPSLSLELPIFDQRQAGIAMATYVVAQRRRELEGLERLVCQEVREAADRARTALELARFYDEEVSPQAERSMELSRDSYRAGKTSVLSVLEAQRSLLAARLGRARAMESAATAIPELERVVGLPMGVILERTAVEGEATAYDETGGGR
jgi:cobalt-zinc-cadmium efflux system outer membrane protein